RRGKKLLLVSALSRDLFYQQRPDSRSDEGRPGTIQRAEETVQDSQALRRDRLLRRPESSRSRRARERDVPGFGHHELDGRDKRALISRYSSACGTNESSGRSSRTHFTPATSAGSRRSKATSTSRRTKKISWNSLSR